MIEALKTNKPVIGKISANIYLTYACVSPPLPSLSGPAIYDVYLIWCSK